jgi:hypothetical protein
MTPSAPPLPPPPIVPAKKIVLANRDDGFGERLCAIINAIRLAAYLDAAFRFTWTSEVWNDVYDKTVATKYTPILGQSIAPKEQIFAPDFIAKYAISYWSKDDFSPIDQGQVTANALAKSSARGWFSTQHHIAADYGISVETACRLSSSDAFHMIKFNDETAALVHQARDIDLGEFTAIHLRSGDMVYGEVRKWGFWGNKVLNPIVALDIIKQANAQGQKVVVFGQDLNWLRHIKTKHDIIVAHDLLGAEVTRPHMRALFEMVLMSRATRIIAGDSGFARAASMIGNKSVTSMFKIYSPIRYSDVTLAGLADVDKHLHPYMTAYAFWQAYAFGRTLRSVPQLIDIIETSHARDPENYLYLVILAALKYRMGHDTDAETLLEKHYALDLADPQSTDHPLNKQIIFRFGTPKYSHEEQFADFIAAARRPGNHHAKHIANIIRADRS